jgi:sarcosine oxidase
MGSAAVYHLARRGATVLGIERYDIPHDFGSSHGLPRIIRLAYWEHPAYVPLVQRAYGLWRDLEDIAHERLLIVTGIVDAGPESSRHVSGARDACRTFALRHEVQHFLIDVVHRNPRVVEAAGFSGHGFKFCSGVGEILAELALDGASTHDISLFTIPRRL